MKLKAILASIFGVLLILSVERTQAAPLTVSEPSFGQTSMGQSFSITDPGNLLRRIAFAEYRTKINIGNGNPLVSFDFFAQSMETNSFADGDGNLVLTLENKTGNFLLNFERFDFFVNFNESIVPDIRDLTMVASTLFVIETSGFSHFVPIETPEFLGIVSAVPIPAAFPFLATALALLGFITWRRNLDTV